MHEIRCELGEGDHDETAFMHPRMRNLQSFFIHDLRPVQEDIEVQSSRTPSQLPAPLSTVVFLYRQEDVQHPARRTGHLHLHDSVQVRPLPRYADRGGLVDPTATCKGQALGLVETHDC